MEVDERPLNRNGTSRVHGQFCASDSDLTIKSSDDVLFLLHRKNLEANTGAFPGPEFSTREEVVHLTEPSNVLELVFQFIYPRRHPTLEGVDFDTVAAVAEAVEKYEVFSAMRTCEVRLSEFSSDHPEPVFLHAVNHDYRHLMDQSACHLLSRPTWLRICEQLPPHFMMPWFKYYNTWRHLFEQTRQDIQNSHYVAGSFCYDFISEDDERESFLDMCKNCCSHSLAWVTDLEKIDSIVQLRKSTSKFKTQWENEELDTLRLCKTCDQHCDGLGPIAKKLRRAIDVVPLFTTFLPPKA